MVSRVYVEKKPGFDGEARALAAELRDIVGISGLTGVRLVNRYDVEGASEELFAACHDYFQKTGRRISFEYAMIDGVNDHDWQADLIARRIAGMPGHVNLIPLNDVVESPFKPSRRTAAFQKRLQSHGVTATVRRSLGGDIDASCGQLRRKAMEEGRNLQ